MTDQKLVKNNIDLSIVLPVRNEAGNLEELHQRLTKVCSDLSRTYEIIYVENGSTDNTLEVLDTLNNATVIVLRWANFMKSGQSAALDAGIKHSSGDIIVTLDSDLQNPPEEIPKLLDLMDEEGLDVVSGWRRKRKDTFLIRNLSKFGSWLRRRFVDPGIHDLGCTLKAYKKECFEGMDIYGEMHRYIVAILKWRGFRVGEIEVEHEDRVYGTSFYNWKKMFGGFADMLLIWFWQKYSSRPLHLFGIGGIFMTLLGVLTFLIQVFARIFLEYKFTSSFMPSLSIVLIVVGIQILILGILFDMLIRIYYSARQSSAYSIKSILTK